MNRDLAYGRPLQRIADFALGATAGLLGVLLLGATIVHLLTPAGDGRAATLPASYAAARVDIPRTPTRPPIAGPIRPPNGARPRVGEQSRIGRGHTQPPPSAARPARVAAALGHGVRVPLPARWFEPPVATARQPRGAAAAPDHAALRHRVQRGGVPRASVQRARVGTAGVAPAGTPRRRFRHYGRPERRLSVRAGSSGRLVPRNRSAHTLKVAALGKRPAPTTLRPRLGQVPHPALARVPIDALPALPVGTTPVRGRVPLPGPAGSSPPSTGASNGAADRPQSFDGPLL